MLSKENRLRKEKDIVRVLKHGRRIYSPLLRFSVLKTSAEFSRCAVVVSTKVAKRSTARNLLKRRIREIVRVSMLDFKYSYDIVINALDESVTYLVPRQKGKRTPHECVASFDSLTQSIAQCIKKINQLHEISHH